MIHDVRVFDRNGQLLRSISKQDLIRRHWEKFDVAEHSKSWKYAGKRIAPLRDNYKSDLNSFQNDEYFHS